MKTFILSLLVFAAVFLFSSAVPRNARNDRHKGLTDSNGWNRETLQRKPPASIPGPQLTAQEQIATFFPGVYTHEDKHKKHLINREKERKKDLSPLDKDKHKDKHLMHSDKHKSERKEEETQQEIFDSV